MNRITSRIVNSLVAVLLSSGLSASYLQAQTDQAMTFKIPFTFTVGAQRIPPGTYRFSLASDPFFLSIVNVRNGHERSCLVRSEQQRGIEPQGRLVFHDYDGSSTLNEIHFLGTETFAEVIQRHGAQRIEAKSSSTGKSFSMAKR